MKLEIYKDFWIVDKVCIFYETRNIWIAYIKCLTIRIHSVLSICKQTVHMSVLGVSIQVE